MKFKKFILDKHQYMPAPISKGDIKKDEVIIAPEVIITQNDDVTPPKNTYRIYARTESNSNFVNCFFCSERTTPELTDVCVIEKELTNGPARDVFVYENDRLCPFDECYMPSYLSEEEKGPVFAMYVVHNYKIVDGRLVETSIEEKDEESRATYYTNKIMKLKNYLDTEWRWKNERYNAELLEIEAGIRDSTTQPKEDIMLLRKDAVDKINYYESLIEKLKEEK